MHETGSTLIKLYKPSVVNKENLENLEKNDKLQYMMYDNVKELTYKILSVVRLKVICREFITLFVQYD